MKYKRKLTPATTFDFAAMETWLSDMAEDGWIPVDFRGGKVKFRQDEPQKRIFRIAIPDFIMIRQAKNRKRHTVSLVGNLSVPTAARAIFWRISRSIPKSLTQTLPYRRKTLRSFIKRNAIFILQAWFSALCFSSA